MIKFVAWLFEFVFFTSLTVLCTLAIIFAFKPEFIPTVLLALSGVFGHV